MKCEKCSYDDHGTGDSAHVCFGAKQAECAKAKPAECEPVAKIMKTDDQLPPALIALKGISNLPVGEFELFATPQPCPKCADGMVEVTKEDANNYCRILTLLGMEEEGSPVDEVERLIALREGMTCADCNDTGWLENREEGRYPCTCMTEAEPYQLLQAKVAELTAERDSADTFGKQIADVCEKAESQAIALMVDKARAEAVIEKCKDALEWGDELFAEGGISGGSCFKHHQTIALAAITEYREGK